MVKVKLKSGVESYDTRIIKSGNIYELYSYEKSIYKGKTSKGGRNEKGSPVSENSEKNREITLSRARKDIRRTINSNVGKYGEISKFMTLTFKDNITDIEISNYEFKKFIQRLNYDVYKSKKSIAKYTVVPEVQKRGAIHYHCVFYNLPYTSHSKLVELWQYGDEIDKGTVNIKKIDKVDNVGAYVCKYLTKDTSSVFEGKKCYFNSRGLLKPLDITNEKEVAQYCEYLATSTNIKLTFNSTFQNDYTGNINYFQYTETEKD